MYDNFISSQGASLTFDGTLKDSAGNAVVNTYTGSEAISTKIWPGGPTPTSFTATTTWLDPAAGTFRVEISAAQTGSLYSGIYQGDTRIDDGSTTPDAYYFTLTIAPGPDGIPAAPTSTSITRIVVETEMIDRAAALLLLLQKSTIADGNNRFLTGPLAFSLTTLGYTPAIPGVVTDTDLAAVPAAQFFILTDLAEYKLLRNLLSGFAQPDQTSANTKIHLNAMKETFRQQMLALEKQYDSYLGVKRATLTGGFIRVRSSAGCDEFGTDGGSWCRR